MRGLDEANLAEDDPLEPISPRPRWRRRTFWLSLLWIGALIWLIVQGFDPSSPTRRFLATLLADVRDPQYGALYVLLAYTVGAGVFAPITVMFVATSLALSPLAGFVYCLLGGLWGGSLAFASGRLLGARALRRLRGPHLDRLAREVTRRPLRAVLIARFLPIGNFTLINLVLGALHVPYWAFALGSLLGMLPGVLGITLCKELLERVLRAPNTGNIALLSAGLVAVLIGLYVAARVVARRRRAALERERAEAQADLTP